MVDQKSPSAFLFAGMNTDSTQDSREEIILSVDFEGQIVIFFNDGSNVLRGSCVYRTGILTPDIFFEPFLVWDLNVKTIRKSLRHGVLNLKFLRRLETPERISLSRLK